MFPELTARLTEVDRAERKAPFREILVAGLPWDPASATDLGIGAASVRGAVDHLVEAGRARMDRRGRVTAAAGFSTESCCSRSNEDWCPNVNLFEDPSSALAWSDEHGVGGRVVSLEEGTDLGAMEWRPLVDGLEQVRGLDVGSSGGSGEEQPDGL